MSEEYDGDPGIRFRSAMTQRDGLLRLCNGVIDAYPTTPAGHPNEPLILILARALKSTLTRPEPQGETPRQCYVCERWVVQAADYDALAAKVQALEGENEVLREQNFEMNKALADKAAEKMPHSFVNMRWACGHEGQAACLQCYQQLLRDLEAARGERDEARSLHARLANSTGYLVDRIKRLEALVREMAREGGQAPTAEKEIARIAAETRTPQAGEE